MRYLVASDIHGSALYCRKLAECFAREGADRLLLLGDILYHGPRNDLPEGYAPKEVIPLLNSLKERVLCVRGNCDAEVDQMVLEFPITADYIMLHLGQRAVLATHGHKITPTEHPHLNEGDIFLSGHTHISGCECREGVIYANPGSISIPKNGTPAGYIILDENGMQWRDLMGVTYMTYGGR